MNEDDQEFLTGISNTLMAAEMIQRAALFLVQLSELPMPMMYAYLEKLTKENLMAIIVALAMGVETIDIDIDIETD